MRLHTRTFCRTYSVPKFGSTYVTNNVKIMWPSHHLHIYFTFCVTFISHFPHLFHICFTFMSHLFHIYFTFFLHLFQIFRALAAKPAQAGPASPALVIDFACQANKKHNFLFKIDVLCNKIRFFNYFY